MAAGMVIARTMKQKAWWLKAHRTLGIAGALILWTGVIMAIIVIDRSGGLHFNIPHAYAGLAVAMLAVATPAAGQMQFKIRAWALKLRTLHRWSGRLTLTLAGVNIILGLLMLG